MLRAGMLMAIVLVGSLWGLQTSTLITPQKPLQTVWDMTPNLPSGRAMPLHFELVGSGVYVDGPRVIVPCVGPSEEANLRGWRDDSMPPIEFSADFQLRSSVKEHLKVGGEAGHQGRAIIRREQTRIEMTLTQMYRVQPGDGSGPRANEEVFRYRYQKMCLTVRIAGTDFVHRLSCYYVPMAEPTLESSRPCSSAPKETGCSYGGFGSELNGTVANYPLPPVDRQPIGYVGATYDVGMAEQIKSAGFEVTGVDINTASISSVNFGAVPQMKWIFLPTGTVLVPGKGGIQSMITVDPALLTSSQLSAVTNGDLPEKSVSVHCLEIDKQSPDSSVRFTLGRASDPVLRNLASFTQRSSVRGPWDQARMWIYTDKATLERINKRLAIGCPPGMYVRSLWEVQTMGGLSDKDLANSEFFKPEFLGAVCNRKEAAAWFVGVLADRHRPVLVQYLSAGAKELADLITSPNPLAAGQFTRTMGQLLASAEPEVRIAMLKFLDAQDPVALKKAVGKPAPTWERHVQEDGEEGELGKKLKEKFG